MPSVLEMLKSGLGRSRSGSSSSTTSVESASSSGEEEHKIDISDAQDEFSTIQKEFTHIRSTWGERVKEILSFRQAQFRLIAAVKDDDPQALETVRSAILTRFKTFIENIDEALNRVDTFIQRRTALFYIHTLFHLARNKTLNETELQIINTLKREVLRLTHQDAKALFACQTGLKALMNEILKATPFASITDMVKLLGHERWEPILEETSEQLPQSDINDIVTFLNSRTRKAQLEAFALLIAPPRQKIYVHSSMPGGLSTDRASAATPPLMKKLSMNSTATMPQPSTDSAGTYPRLK